MAEAELLDQLPELVGLAKVAGLTELVDQLAKLRSQLIGLIGRAGLLDQLAKLLEQLTGLVGLAR
ncbi:MAG: hypothetical protein M3Y48_22090 [Actinomycetota bacterium]|nr:hypothetical protein [Actinomycetota bacterium]